MNDSGASAVVGERPSRNEPLARSRSQGGLPPHDLAAEEAVLAGLLLDEGAVFRVMPLLDPADFFRDGNGWCYEAAIGLAERGESITLTSLAHALLETGRLDAAGGEVYLAELAGKYFTAVGVEAHARIVARDALYRRTIDAAGQIARAAYQGGADATEVLQRARGLLDGVETGVRETATQSVGQALKRLGEDAPQRRISTGYRALDRQAGLAPGQIAVVAGRTDAAKTALQLGMAARIASAGVPVLYVPLEDTVDEIATRLTDQRAGTSRDFAMKMGWGRSSEAVWLRAQLELAELPLFLPDAGRTPGSIESLTAMLATSHHRDGVRVAFIDHIDALPIDRGLRGRSDASVVAAWMRDLKRIAIQLDLALVVASQVNREADRDPSIVPRMFHLKESSAKEQAAQTVLMIGLESDDAKNAQIPVAGRWLAGYVEKVKGYPNGRWLTAGGGSHALYLDDRSGAVLEIDAPREAP